METIANPAQIDVPTVQQQTQQYQDSNIPDPVAVNPMPVAAQMGNEVPAPTVPAPIPIPVPKPVPLPVVTQLPPQTTNSFTHSNFAQASEDNSQSPTIQFQQQFQRALDKVTPHKEYRWIAFTVLVLLYIVRVFFLEGFYIVTYGLGIYNLNLLIGFLTPQMDMDSDGPSLPTKADQEYKPFVRRLPEFKFWYASTKSFVIGFLMTFFPVFDVPVFWPILLMYWFILFFVTMKRQIKHMIKYKYVPFSWGKQTYNKRKGAKNNK